MHIAPIYMHYFQLVSKRLNFLPSIDYIEPHLQLNHSEIALSLPVLAGLSFIQLRSLYVSFSYVQTTLCELLSSLKH
jgi:hypothetical protein